MNVTAKNRFISRAPNCPSKREKREGGVSVSVRDALCFRLLDASAPQSSPVFILYVGASVERGLVYNQQFEKFCVWRSDTFSHPGD